MKWCSWSRGHQVVITENQIPRLDLPGNEHALFGEGIFADKCFRLRRRVRSVHDDPSHVVLQRTAEGDFAFGFLAHEIFAMRRTRGLNLGLVRSVDYDRGVFHTRSCPAQESKVRLTTALVSGSLYLFLASGCAPSIAASPARAASSGVNF